MSDSDLQSKIIQMHCKTIQEQTLKIDKLKRQLAKAIEQRNKELDMYMIARYSDDLAERSKIYDEELERLE